MHCLFYHRVHIRGEPSCQLSDYAQSLEKEAKERYVEKLLKVGCTVDPYLDSYANELSLLPAVKYSHIYDFIGNHMIDGSDPQRAFKSLDGYHMVVSNGWMGGFVCKEVATCCYS